MYIVTYVHYYDHISYHLEAAERVGMHVLGDSILVSDQTWGGGVGTS